MKTSLKTEPLMALGVAGSLVGAVVVALFAAGIVSADQGTALISAAVVVVPFVQNLIGRQFVTPNSKVPPATTPVVTSPGELNAADIAALKRYIANLEAVKNPTDEQERTLDTYLARLAAYEARLGYGIVAAPAEAAPAPLVALAPEPAPAIEPAGPRFDPTPLPVVTDDWFVEFSTNDPYLIGGTANGNPNGATFRPSDAIAWFRYVVANKIGYHHVRATLLPGSHVLTATGYAQVVAFEKRTDLIEAPEDFNPLNLAVVA